MKTTHSTGAESAGRDIAKHTRANDILSCIGTTTQSGKQIDLDGKFRERIGNFWRRIVVRKEWYSCIVVGCRE